MGDEAGDLRHQGQRPTPDAEASRIGHGIAVAENDHLVPLDVESLEQEPRDQRGLSRAPRPDHQETTISPRRATGMDLRAAGQRAESETVKARLDQRAGLFGSLDDAAILAVFTDTITAGLLAHV